MEEIILPDNLHEVNLVNSSQRILDNTLTKYKNLETCRQSMLDSFYLLCSCFSNGGKLLCCGNGGSASDCDHIVGELMKSFKKMRPISNADSKKIEIIFEGASQYLQKALPTINLASQTALYTAYLNDCNPSMVYAQLTYGYARDYDVLLCISTSGNSENILAAAKVAKAIGIKVIGLTGQNGGLLKAYCDVCIKVPEKETYLIQELHLPVYHTICAMLEEWMTE